MATKPVPEGAFTPQELSFVYQVLIEPEVEKYLK
jgi:hypothetical protein